MSGSNVKLRVHVTNFNTATSAELCIRSMRELADYPFELVVGDSGSVDGSLEMLGELLNRGWLRELQTDCSGHAQWLDRWLRTDDAQLVVFVDSDVEFRRRGWLRQMVDTATSSSAALCCAEMVREVANFIEPVSGQAVRLAARPSSWLFMVDLAAIRDVQTSFAFHAEETDAVPEGVIAFDVGACFYRDLTRMGLRTVVMPRSFGASFHHYGGLSWLPEESQRSRRKSSDLRIVARHLQRLRARQEDGKTGLARWWQRRAPAA
jgi:glycosyltransferase involved in cell wall biosynthesis